MSFHGSFNAPVELAEPNPSMVLRRWFKRRDPIDDCPANVVQVVGVTQHSDASGEVVTPLVAVTTAEFGAIPDGWDATTATFSFDDFQAEFDGPLTSEQVALIGAETALAAIEGTQASEARRIDAEARHLLAVERRAKELRK